MQPTNENGGGPGVRLRKPLRSKSKQPNNSVADVATRPVEVRWGNAAFLGAEPLRSLCINIRYIGIALCIAR